MPGRLRPQDPATLQNVAEALRKQERYEEALPAYRAVLEIDADMRWPMPAWAMALFRLERYAEAMETLARAATLQPDLPMAGSLHRLMGRAAQELGRPDAADHFERAVRLDPGDAEALDRLAMLRFGEQNYEAAYGLYRACSRSIRTTHRPIPTSAPRCTTWDGRRRRCRASNAPSRSPRSWRPHGPAATSSAGQCARRAIVLSNHTLS